MTYFLKRLQRLILSTINYRLYRTGLLVTVLVWGGLVVPPPPLAQAQVFNFLFGGRENRGGRAPNRRKGGGVRAGRLVGGCDITIPVVITPRNTFQPTDQFPIRWQPVVGVSTYTVRLWEWQDANGGRQRVIWETTTPDTTVTYRGEPPLAPETFYSIEVITDQGVSSEQDPGCAIAGFAVLFPEMRSQLYTELATLDSPDLSPEEQALATAELYLDYQMLDAAIATLAPQFDAQPTATLALALGDLYSFSGLNTLAAHHYTQALDLAATDQLWQAIALEGLGELSVLRNDLTTALPQLRQAQTHYTAANTPLKANQLRQRIALLEHAQRLGLQPSDTSEVCNGNP